MNVRQAFIVMVTCDSWDEMKTNRDGANIVKDNVIDS